MNLSEKISLILVDKGFSLSPKKNTEELINSGTEFHKSNEDIKIAEQHGIADQIFILLKGENAKAEFNKCKEHYEFSIYDRIELEYYKTKKIFYIPNPYIHKDN